MSQRAALRLQRLAGEYTQTYGKRHINNGELDYAVEGIERLVIWKIGS